MQLKYEKGNTITKIKNYLSKKKIFKWLSLIIAFGYSKSQWRKMSKELEIVHSLNNYRIYKSTLPIVQKNANEYGIWIEKGITFSIYGNLRKTIINSVHKSKAGYTSKELKKIIHKSSKNEILKLYKEGKLLRIKQRKEYVYLSNNFKIAKNQILARHQMHPKRRLYFNGKFMEHLLVIISTSIRKIIKELMDKNNIDDPTGEKIEILIASSIRPLINGGRTDKEFARFLKKNMEYKGLYQLKGKPPCYNKICNIKREFGVKNYRMVMIGLIKNLINILNLKEISVVLDGMHIYQTHHNKRGIKLHSACVAELGFPVGTEIMEDGMAYDLDTLYPLLEQIQKLGIKIRFVIGDGLYDAPAFYYAVPQILGAEGVAKYNHRRSKFTEKPEEINITECLLQLIKKHDEAVESNKKKRRGRKRNIPKKKLELSDPEVQAKLFRNNPVTPWESEKRRELEKKRTIIERLHSLLHNPFNIERKGLNRNARNINIFSSFISILAVSLFAAELNLGDYLFKVNSFRL